MKLVSNLEIFNLMRTTPYCDGVDAIDIFKPFEISFNGDVRKADWNAIVYPLIEREIYLRYGGNITFNVALKSVEQFDFVVKTTIKSAKKNKIKQSKKFLRFL